MEGLAEKSIGQLVAENYRTAPVFKNRKIDFCCQGNRTMEEGAERKKVDLKLLLEEIGAPQQNKIEETIDFKSWPLDLLIDYIEKKHHRYVETKIPILKSYLEKLCKVHGANHPKLYEITEFYTKCAGELAAHMKKEELVLFPDIRKMVLAKRTGSKMEKPHFGAFQNPIQKMMEEHETEGQRFRQIGALSGNYTPPADACTTYRGTFSLLQEFENDLHKHIHLENNILFPRAALLEEQLNYER